VEWATSLKHNDDDNIVLSATLSLVMKWAWKRAVCISGQVCPLRTVSTCVPNALCWNMDVVNIKKYAHCVVGIATGYGLDEWGAGVRVPVWSRIFTSPYSPGRLCGPPNLLSNGYRMPFPRGQSCRVVKLTTHLQPVQRSRKHGPIHRLSRTS
jgi:hypothetical protein